MKLKLSETLKHLRRGKGLTQDDVALALGVSFQAVSRWENDLSYPDIELLPHIASLLDVSMDELFGMDEACEKIRKEQYKTEDEACGEDIQAQIRLAKKYIALSPKNVYFKHRLLELYRCCGLEFAQSVLPEMRSMCRFILDHTSESDFERYRALINLIWTEDEEQLDVWLSEFGCGSRKKPHMTHNPLIGRYHYRNEIEKYNRAIQEDILSGLRQIFRHDFRRMDADNRREARSCMIGRQAILRVIDIFRDPGIEADAWITDRICAYLSLSAGCFGCGEKEDGYQALERCVELCELYAKVPDGTVLYFNSPILDIISETSVATEVLSGTYERLTEPEGWEWFNCVRGEERFRALAARVKALLPG